MARQEVRSHGDLGGRIGKEAWYLATCSDVVLFYQFDAPETSSSTIDSFTLVETFDRTRLPAAGDKKTAASWAKRLGLSSWSYVRI